MNAWHPDEQRRRRDLLWQTLRPLIHGYYTADGTFVQPDGSRATPDHRVVTEHATILLDGEDADRSLAHTIMRANDLRIGRCSFATDYILALWHSVGEHLEPALRDWIREQVAAGLHTYAKRDLQHHGFNDNHVTMATSSLILGGELVGDTEAIEEGRANLLNLRDTLLRRGLIHEADDCYFWHTMYSTAAVARWAADAECRDLAAQAEHRLWAEHAAFHHPHLGRKIGPSARDYVGGRLAPRAEAVALWLVLGDAAIQPYLPPAFITPADPTLRPWHWPGHSPQEDSWLSGFCGRVAANTYVVPDDLARLFADRPYPHVVSATNETGHFPEGYDVQEADGTKTFHHLNALQFPGQEHQFYTYMEPDWGMGTGDGRMIGACPNNTWQLSYRKAAPTVSTRDQGHWWCTYVVNGKTPVENCDLQFVDPAIASGETGTFHYNSVTRPQHIAHWADHGRFAGMQHERTTMMLYRPRPVEAWRTTRLALTLAYPLVWDNALEGLWFGDREVRDWDGTSVEFADIIVADGPVYVGFRPLACGALTAPHRLHAEQRGGWGLIHMIAHDGPAVDLAEEADLCRVGSGFVCEVARREEFASAAAFREWFAAGRVVDQDIFGMRHVRWHRPGLTLGMRYDVRNDHIMWRLVNGRSMPQPQWSCTNIPAGNLPWLTGDVTDLDHFEWAVRQAARPLADHVREPDRRVP